MQAIAAHWAKTRTGSPAGRVCQQAAQWDCAGACCPRERRTARHGAPHGCSPGAPCKSTRFRRPAKAYPRCAAQLSFQSKSRLPVKLLSIDTRQCLPQLALRSGAAPRHCCLTCMLDDLSVLGPEALGLEQAVVEGLSGGTTFRCCGQERSDQSKRLFIPSFFVPPGFTL